MLRALRATPAPAIADGRRDRSWMETSRVASTFTARVGCTTQNATRLEACRCASSSSTRVRHAYDTSTGARDVDCRVRFEGIERLRFFSPERVVSVLHSLYYKYRIVHSSLPVVVCVVVVSGFS